MLFNRLINDDFYKNTQFYCGKCIIYNHSKYVCLTNN